MITVSLSGDRELYQKLSAMSNAAASDVLEKGVVAGATIVQKGAQARVRRRSNKLAGAIKVAVGEKSRDRAVAGVRISRKGFYWRFIEFGHVIKRTRKGPVVGHAPAYPFLRPAFDESKDQIKDVVADTIRNAILGAVR